MDMCYDGALVLPSSYAVMNKEEMSYTEGGISRATAKGIVIGAVTTLVAAVAKNAVKKSLIGAAIDIAGSWVAGIIDLAIIAAYVHPVAATIISVAGLGAITGTVYAIGKKKHWWR